MKISKILQQLKRIKSDNATMDKVYVQNSGFAFFLSNNNGVRIHLSGESNEDEELDIDLFDTLNDKTLGKKIGSITLYYGDNVQMIKDFECIAALNLILTEEQIGLFKDVSFI
jgi:hypothetical protein